MNNLKYLERGHPEHSKCMKALVGQGRGAYSTVATLDHLGVDVHKGMGTGLRQD